MGYKVLLLRWQQEMLQGSGSNKQTLSTRIDTKSQPQSAVRKSDALVELCRRLLLYPLIQSLSQMPILWGSFAYADDEGQNRFANSPFRRSYLFCYSLLSPASGMLLAAAYIAYQPEAKPVLRRWQRSLLEGFDVLGLWLDSLKKWCSGSRSRELQQQNPGLELSAVMAEIDGTSKWSSSSSSSSSSSPSSPEAFKSPSKASSSSFHVCDNKTLDFSVITSSVEPAHTPPAGNDSATTARHLLRSAALRRLSDDKLLCILDDSWEATLAADLEAESDPQSQSQSQSQSQNQIRVLPISVKLGLGTDEIPEPVEGTVQDTSSIADPENLDLGDIYESNFENSGHCQATDQDPRVQSLSLRLNAIDSAISPLHRSQPLN